MKCHVFTGKSYIVCVVILLHYNGKMLLSVPPNGNYCNKVFAVVAIYASFTGLSGWLQQ